ncbi:MAG: lytic transglycosylase domain-containing protein [Bryobacteraceae bacterium]|nr:lytic transglycosylase domain-containing protein [Bryobacteraceae bacterium]
MSQKGRRRVVFWLAFGLAAASFAAWGGDKYIRRELVITAPPSPAPRWELGAGHAIVTAPDRFLVAEVAAFENEFFAYLVFDYLRTRPLLKFVEVMLTADVTDHDLRYAILLHLPNDLIEAMPLLARVRVAGYIGDYEWRYLSHGALNTRRLQTSVFLTAYNFPGRPKLPSLTRQELAVYMGHFVRFKSLTDPRVRRGLDPEPVPLTSQQAGELANDIIDVCEFYALPIDFFLGIGAMENNYMDVKGDLGHSVWKKRAEKGDVILRRRRGRVLVLNESSGVWQITRETLRYAHRRYLQDCRDYALLPEYLRPPKELDLDKVDPRVLTTYAGLLFRDLLDRFDGDIATAVGAYNGGPGNPNPAYEEGVRLVALYARQVLEQAAGLRGRRVTEMSFLRPSRQPLTP